LDYPYDGCTGLRNLPHFAFSDSYKHPFQHYLQLDLALIGFAIITPFEYWPIFAFSLLRL
jgi:hypothetical protein